MFGVVKCSIYMHLWMLMLNPCREMIGHLKRTLSQTHGFQCPFGVCAHCFSIHKFSVSRNQRAPSSRIWHLNAKNLATHHETGAKVTFSLTRPNRYDSVLETGIQWCHPIGSREMRCLPWEKGQKKPWFSRVFSRISSGCQSSSNPIGLCSPPRGWYNHSHRKHAHPMCQMCSKVISHKFRQSILNE